MCRDIHKSTKVTMFSCVDIHVFDFKSFFDRHMNANMEHHSKYRAFRFCRDADGNAEMFYKESVLDKVWRGHDNSLVEGIHHFLFAMLMLLRD